MTGGFTSSNLVEALFSVGALLLLARLVEPVYGSTELLRFILVVDVSACAMTFIMAFLVFIFAPQEHKGKTLCVLKCVQRVLSAPQQTQRQLLHHHLLPSCLQHTRAANNPASYDMSHTYYTALTNICVNLCHVTTGTPSFAGSMVSLLACWLL